MGLRLTTKNLSPDTTIIVLFWGYFARGFFGTFFPKNGIYDPEMTKKLEKYMTESPFYSPDMDFCSAY